MIKDSGERRTFDTGAQRDRAFGKGRPTLISPEFTDLLYIRGMWINNSLARGNICEAIFDCFKLLQRYDIEYVSSVIYTIMAQFPTNVEALRQLSKHMEEGAKKYSDRNWEKGMPLCEYLDSCIRHCWAVAEGKRDENHKAAALFNIMAFYHTYCCIQKGTLPKELNNLPGAKNVQSQ